MGRTPTVGLTERVPVPDLGRVPVALAGLILAVDLAVLAAAFVPLPWVVLAGAAALAALEVALTIRAPFLRWTLARLAAGAPVRALLRGIALLVLLVRADAPDAWTAWAAAAVVAAHLLRLLGTGLAELSARRRKMPMVTRGLDLGLGRLPAAPPAWPARNASDVLSWPVLALLAGGAVSISLDEGLALSAGAALALGAVLAGDIVLARAVWAVRHLSRRRFQAAVEQALAGQKPVVALYFAGGPESAYQLEMWIEPLERMSVPEAGEAAAAHGHGPVLLILRDREMFRRLGPTRLPVLCVEPGNMLMGLDLPALRLALYPSHAVGNLHLLRRRGVVHVFIGHGDSDKPVTVNPFLKAYDQIWVSGPAARERLLTAGIGVDGDRVREIGRPQLDALARAAPGAPSELPARQAPAPQAQTPQAQTPQAQTQQALPSPAGEVLTVLYTPTWEGYDDEPSQTSVGPAGIELVRRLIAEPGVRVLYRPHPLLGSRDRAVARAHREILALLGDPDPPEPPAWSDPYAYARDELEIAGVRPGGLSRADRAEASAAWAAAVIEGGRGHMLVPGPQVPLTECLIAATVLVSDVSSVITEFLATEKAYGVTNPAGLREAEFRVGYPSSRGGYLIGPDGSGLAGLLAAGRGDGDPAAAERSALRQALLGTQRPPAAARMREAIGRAVEG